MSLGRLSHCWVGHLVPGRGVHGTLLAGRLSRAAGQARFAAPRTPGQRWLAASAAVGAGPEALQALARKIAADGALAERLAAEPSAAELLRVVRHADMLPRTVAATPSVTDPEVCNDDNLDGEPPVPTMWQMRTYCLQNLIPFIGFGFFDNFVMILAGDFIDAKLGLAFGLTTMAAAAVGNTISDIIGLWVSGFVEAFASALGLPDHGLTNAQRRTVRIRVVKNCSMVVGLVIGCVVGMFPLIYPHDWRLWPSRDQREKAKATPESNDTD
mmetsp:Transcript_112445/g.350439  ORF Transcript_112445/g.350439 Transcript_112445/m.350439 type:complete len:270 (-) Transcript_112445:239-1048(-)